MQCSNNSNLYTYFLYYCMKILQFIFTNLYTNYLDFSKIILNLLLLQIIINLILKQFLISINDNLLIITIIVGYVQNVIASNEHLIKFQMFFDKYSYENMYLLQIMSSKMFEDLVITQG